MRFRTWGAAALLVCLSGAVDAQVITRDVVIDEDPPYGEPLEKIIDYFTSPRFPSVVIGSGGRGGVHLYQSTSGNLEGPWKHVQISAGNAYERARAVRFPGNAYPDIVASLDNQIVWLENPKNLGTDPDVSRPWPRHVINPEHGCHDIRLADLDGDGRIDVICSASISLSASQFVAFQDDRDRWQVVYDLVGAGDGVAVLHVGTDPTPNLVSADEHGDVYWYENPRMKGGNARTSPWTRHYIGPGNKGNSFAAGPFSSARDDVITAANEHEGKGGGTDNRGITLYRQPEDPYGRWPARTIGSGYRDVHEINLGRWNGDVAYLSVAEQEQACRPARPEGRPPDHPGEPCRLTMFQWLHGALRRRVLAATSMQNQSVVLWDGRLLMADANHGAYGASRSIHLRVIEP